MRRTFGGLVYTSYDHATDRRSASLKAQRHRERGLSIRVTKDPAGGYLLWKRGEVKPSVAKEERATYRRLKKAGRL